MPELTNQAETMSYDQSAAAAVKNFRKANLQFPAGALHQRGIPAKSFCSRATYNDSCGKFCDWQKRKAA
jgi:hypothetical protein